MIRKALRAEHGKAEMESLISQLEATKTRLEKEVIVAIIVIMVANCHHHHTSKKLEFMDSRHRKKCQVDT